MAEPAQAAAAAKKDKKPKAQAVEIEVSDMICLPLSSPSSSSQLNPPPAYIAERIAIFDKIYAEQQAEVAGESACIVPWCSL